ncbi:hydroxyacid dehydrogenase [Peribacillus sp. SCS-155]|uniref:hydroxyacid dehydrogenase n=1 Tax=Peribacillus sedimenti TaxID=3115297 RepID=UPI0039062C48
MAKPKMLQILSMYHEEGERILNEGAEVIRTDKYAEASLCRIVSDVEGIVLRAPAKLTRKIIDAAPNLRAISGAGVGLDNIDVKYATEKGIPVLHAPSVNAVSTAEHAVMLMMALSKNVIGFHKEMCIGNYDSRMKLKSFELKGKTAGILGFGSIAKEVAKRLKMGLEMDVLVWVREYDESKHGLARDIGAKVTTDLEHVFSTSDYISIHIPLTKATKGLIERRYIQQMKPTAFLVNTARGAIINQDDILEALNADKIAGAALDVFDPEPPPRNLPLLSHPKVIVTPHVGGTTVESNRVMAATVAKNILNVLAGGRPEYIGNPEVMKKVW